MFYIKFVALNSSVASKQTRYTTDRGKLNTWKRRLVAFSGNTFLFIF
jgi:hypothetical protein